MSVNLILTIAKFKHNPTRCHTKKRKLLVLFNYFATLACQYIMSDNLLHIKTKKVLLMSSQLEILNGEERSFYCYIRAS